MGTTCRGFVVVASIALLVGGAARAEVPELQYGFQPGRHYGYDITINIDTEDYTETLTGYNLFRVVSAQDDRITLEHQGILDPDRKKKPGAGLMGFGPQKLRPFPCHLVIDRQGKLVRAGRLQPLPHILGQLETLVLERLPPEPKSQWEWEEEFRMVQRAFLSAAPFGGESRNAKEQIDCTIADVKGDLVRVEKRYEMRTGGGSTTASRAKMNGSGSFLFDRKEGVVSSITMNYNLLLKDDSGSHNVTAGVQCRLMNSDRLEQLLADLENKRKQVTGEAYADEPKRPLERTERAKLLRDLRSRDAKAVEAALVRLIAASADDQPADFAVPLAKIVREGEFSLQTKAARALVVWGTPEAVEALAQATDDHRFQPGAAAGSGYPLAEAAYEALGNIGTESAARAIAQKIDEPTRTPIEVLKRMGSAAEVPMIELLSNYGSVFEPRAACEVLAEVGGLRSVPALQQAAEQGNARSQAQAALEAIAEREGLSVEELLAKAESAAPPAVPAPDAAASSGFRTWTDDSGQFKVEAEMVSVSDGVVTLKTREGKTVDVPLDRLSQEDRELVAGRAEVAAAPPPPRRTLPRRASPRRTLPSSRFPRPGSPANASPGRIVGGPGGGPFRSVSPQGLPVVGVRYRLGNWAGKPAIASIDPLYDRTEPAPLFQSVIAREGYALGAIQVDADDLVRAVRFAFMKIDGNKLDTSDSYVSDWIGTQTGGELVVLDAKGKRILGFCGRRAAVVDALGIVVETP